ncbi:MAG: GTP-binding protein [Solirubrobacteraceae bacterium]|nr:GTP-binding protein [Solirubrobacteraceae bacterium]
MSVQTTHGHTPHHPELERIEAADLVRVATAGSVDDGKSTLIGRLLYDSKQVLADQLEQVEAASVRRHGEGVLDLSLLTDGLRAEREQGITIDVAYRYFTTGRRTFVLADTPGHVQYTRNMVTGASTADVAIVLVDARQGVVEQTRRHLFIAALLGIRHIVVALNKMDLVDWSQARYDELSAELGELAASLGEEDLRVIPISALHGDNVTTKSEASPWYTGPALLETLETVEVEGDQNRTDLRFPVQWVIRPGDAESHELHDYRGYGGQLASGVLTPGTEVTVLPSGTQSRIASIEIYGDQLEVAVPGQSVTITLEDDVDVSRGDVIVDAAQAPEPLREIDADLCWMSERPLQPGARLLLKTTTQSTPVKVDAFIDQLDLETLTRDEQVPSHLNLNGIGGVRLRSKRPLVVDPYATNRATGAFILIDEGTNDTVAAGMVRG